MGDDIAGAPPGKECYSEPLTIKIAWRIIGWVSFVELTAEGCIAFSAIAFSAIAFSALTLLVGRQEGHPACKKLSGGRLVWLSAWGADLHIAQQMPLPLTISCSSKSRLVLTFMVLPFWYLLTRVDPDIFQTSSKTVVCVCV